MAKQTGLAWTTLTVEDADGTTARDIRNDVTDFDFATPREVQDVTGIDKSAMERLLLLADFSIKLHGVCNFGAVPSATAHGVFATVPSTSIQRTTVIGIGGKSLTNQVLYTDYAIKRDKNGELTYEVPGVLADGTVPTWA
jgi:hypothetical protein